ncbi:MAG: nitroreductase family protein [Patescibacteria group bacterium]
MDTLTAIETRRSVRGFEKRKVPKTKIKKILEAAALAPSSKNSQPWCFHVIENKKMIEKIGKLLGNSENISAEPSDPKTGKIRDGFASSVNASGIIIEKAPLVIIIENSCPFSHNRAEVMNSKYPNAINGHDSEVLSLGACLQNISLAVHALDLGTVIIADVVSEEQKLKKLLKVKGDIVAAMPIGFPAYRPAPKKPEMNCVKYF